MLRLAPSFFLVVVAAAAGDAGHMKPTRGLFEMVIFVTNLI